MGEFSRYNVNELFEITATDNEEAMDSIATGWVNTGSVLGTAKEALKERLEQLREVWTAPSFAAFESFINKTIAQVEAAETQADNRSEAASKVASTAGWARERVGEQYQQYLAATLKEATDGGSTDPSQLTDGVPSPGQDEELTPEQVRAPFDKQARKIMTVALEEYESNKPAMTQEVVRFKPIQTPGDIDDSKWLAPGEDGWGSDGVSGSNAVDTAGLSAASYGGNALGSQGPALQSAGHAPTAPATGTPTGGGPPPSSFSSTPVGGLPPAGMGANRAPTAPPKLPVSSPGQAKTTLPPRGSHSAQRTPSLPNRSNTPVRNGVPSSGRSTNRWAGRGLQKSQMAPTNRVGQPRKAGEVLGQRRSAAKSSANALNKNSTAPRKTQPAVVRGANKSGKLQSGKKSPVDNTKRGFTSRVLNPRNRFADGHSRTPYVGAKLNTTTKPEPFGKRPEPETRRKKIRREIDAVREARRRKLTQSKDGLSRPIISNGVSSPAQLDHAVPTPREAIEAEEGFWQPPNDIVRGVIGKRDWDPDAIDHDPGHVLNARSAHIEDLDSRVNRIHEPGPKAFDAKRRVVDPWPQV